MRPMISYEDISLPYDDNEAQEPPPKKQKKEVEEDSRELTYEEIWDDSALVNAWNAATEEYEAYHGPGKGWKKDPVHKSPLWYNVPPSSKPKFNADAKQPPAPPAQEEEGDEGGENSQPLNFDTFVPTHDPSLDLPQAPGMDYALPDPSGPMVSQDEAFTRALNAMYWGGYWTAVYHCHRQRHREAENEEEGGDDDDAEEEVR